MCKRYVGHTVAWELPNRDSVTKGNYNLEDIETKYLPMQTEVVSDNKDHTIDELKQRIAELEEQLKNAIVPKFKYGQDVWCVYPTNEHRQGFVFELEFVGYTKDKIICCITENEEFEYDEVFETKEEAKAKLKELGEKK